MRSDKELGHVWGFYLHRTCSGLGVSGVLIHKKLPIHRRAPDLWRQVWKALLRRRARHDTPGGLSEDRADDARAQALVARTLRARHRDQTLFQRAACRIRPLHHLWQEQETSTQDDEKKDYLHYPSVSSCAFLSIGLIGAGCDLVNMSVQSAKLALMRSSKPKPR